MDFGGSCCSGAGAVGGCGSLVLGTVQLGMRYGVANVSGQPDADAADAIVAAVWECGVRFFDTAQAYGASEEVLGRALAFLGGGSQARVVTKLNPGCNYADERAVLGNLEISARRIQVGRLWGLLLHREEDLDRWQGSISKTFKAAKGAGLVERVGVSVYSPERALQALENEEIDIIQVPSNVFDRRMARAGFFERAGALGKVAFVRSVYLQGLALLPPGAPMRGIPRAAQAVEALHRFCAERGIAVRQFAVDHVRAVAPQAKVIIGAETVDQARDNCGLFSRASDRGDLHQAWAEAWPQDFPELIDPRRWPSRG